MRHGVLEPFGCILGVYIWLIKWFYLKILLKYTDFHSVVQKSPFLPFFISPSILSALFLINDSILIEARLSDRETRHVSGELSRSLFPTIIFLRDSN